jgi:hypothetical protein
MHARFVLCTPVVVHLLDSVKPRLRDFYVYAVEDGGIGDRVEENMTPYASRRNAKSSPTFCFCHDVGKRCRGVDVAKIPLVGWIDVGSRDRSASSSICTPTPSLLAQSRSRRSPMTANGSQVRAALATTTPGQPTQTLVTVTRCSRSTVPALVEIVLFFHAEQTLLFLNPLAVDTAAAHSAIDTETTARTTNTGCGGDAVDAGVDGVAGGASFFSS